MTAPAYQDDSVTVHLGDCLDVLPTLPDGSVDAIVTDPPYGLDFMGKHWDTGAVAFNPDTWRHCLRVLKPGGHLLAFGGTRTWHRLACAIEDAGLEIRENLAWLYGSGFPKSLDVSKAIDRAAGAQREIIGTRPDFQAKRAAQVRRGLDANRTFNEAHDPGRGGYTDPSQVGVISAPATAAAKQWAGWGTSLKPAFEPIILARKPLAGTVAQNVLAHGVGGLNIDACRIATDDTLGRAKSGWLKGGYVGGESPQWDSRGTTVEGGRWPANVILDPAAATLLDQQSGTTTSLGGSRGQSGDGWGMDAQPDVHPGYGDTGGASRFFYTTPNVRPGGTGPVAPVIPAEGIQPHATTRFFYTPKASADERPTHNGTSHPTVKPVELMRWLVRLVTPPHGLILDPFAGTGSTGEAAIHEHMRAILIEREPDYLPLITARLRKPMQVGFDFNEVTT